MVSTIKKGDIGEAVKVIQYLTGYSERNKADGVFDDSFLEYFVNWQETHGLEPNGVCDEKSLKAIVKILPTCSTSKNKTSAYACAIQIILGGLEVDGIYGSKTKNAVAAFQAANGLEVDGICGQKTWTCLLGACEFSSAVPDGKVINKCVYYCQWDSRWKNIKYSTHTSEQTIGNSGCGTTSAAMIIATFCDPKITPVEMSALAVKKGYRTENSGTDAGFFKYIADQYAQIGQFTPSKSLATIKSALSHGALVIVNVNNKDNNFWTKHGHYIVAVGYDQNGCIYANDPNKTSHPRKQKEDKFVLCMKGAWIFWPVESDNGDPANEPAPEKPQTSNGKKVMISGGDCNIRTIASTSGRIVGVAKNGTIMDYGGQTAANGWLLVSGDAGSGWVSNKYGHLI